MKGRRKGIGIALVALAGAALCTQLSTSTTRGGGAEASLRFSPLSGAWPAQVLASPALRPAPRSFVRALKDGSLTDLVGAARSGRTVAAPRRWTAVTGPTIDVVRVSPKEISNQGGSALVHLEVRRSSRCTVQGQHVAFAALSVRRVVNCTSGRADVRMPVGANRYQKAVKLHFVVTAFDAHSHRARRAVAVVQEAKQAPAPPPPPAASPLAVTTSALPAATVGSPYSQTLSASGGTPPYHWSVVSGSLPPGLTLSDAGVLAGTPTTAGNYSFAVGVSDANTASAQATLTLAVAGSAPPPASVPTVTSDNWSGYVLAGSTYTGVGGTFNVPALHAAASDGSVGEWLGLDGISASDPTILQLGIGEDYTAASNSYDVYAWIELFPAPAVPLPLAIAPGNEITVVALQASAGVWNVGVKDETTGLVWTATVSYTGPAISAEWIVEAPTTVGASAPDNLASFDPVTFTRLGITPQPAQGSLTRVVLAQNGQTVATPSDLSQNGFTVVNGAATPAAP